MTQVKVDSSFTVVRGLPAPTITVVLFLNSQRSSTQSLGQVAVGASKPISFTVDLPDGSYVAEIEVVAENSLGKVSVFSTETPFIITPTVPSDNLRDPYLSAYPETSGIVPLIVNFDAGASVSVKATPYSYVLEFGDGEQASGQTNTDPPIVLGVSHTYTRTGSFTPKVTWKDSAGNTVSKTGATITVSPQPIGAAEVKLAIASGTKINLTVDASEANGGRVLASLTAPFQFPNTFAGGSAGIVCFKNLDASRTWFLNWVSPDGSRTSLIVSIDEPVELRWFSVFPSDAEKVGWACGASASL